MVQRHLADLRECFAGQAAYDAALAQGNPQIYAVTAVEPASGDGQLHYGLGIIYPGKIGREYFQTKGHYHSYRPAAEIYIGLKGEGIMLLEDEATGESRMVPLHANSAVYVPGHTAHRTMNTGSEPLVYIGVYPSNAGHDYGAIAKKNFRNIVVEHDGQPVLLDR
jgi:glucose-6-phosphate isomerase